MSAIGNIGDKVERIRLHNKQQILSQLNIV